MWENDSAIEFSLSPGWLDYNNLNIYGKSLFQPEYRILKKAFEESILRLFDNQNEIMQLNLSPAILLEVEEMAKNQTQKSDIECKFFENASDVPDPRELSPEKKESYGIRRLTFRKTEQVRSVLHQR